jgi:enoyl-CoA hydratase
MSSSAFLLVPEARIGLPLGWHTVPRLVNIVGPARAKRIILTNERMDAATAFEWGLADWLSEPGQTVSLAQELAANVAASPAAVIRMTKQSVNAYANALNHVATFMDVDQALLSNQSEEALAARKAFSKP